MFPSWGGLVAGKLSPIYYPCGSNLGDVWMYFNYLLGLLNSGSSSVRTAVRASNGGLLETKLTEMKPLFVQGHRIQLTHEPGHILVQNWARHPTFPHPYYKTLTFWRKGKYRRICYQFDGTWKGELKNPPPSDVLKLSSWLPGIDFVRLGAHLTLAECVRIASKSDLFLGVDSGMAHLCESVGTPRFLVQYNNWDLGPYHLPGTYTLCVGTTDAMKKVEAFLKQGGNI